MVIREKLKEMIGVLRQYGSDNAVFEAHQLMRFATNFSATDLVIHHSDKLTDEMQKKIDALIKRRTGGEPLQYILGTQEFMSLEFYVNRSVLIPRADMGDDIMENNVAVFCVSGRLDAVPANSEPFLTVPCNGLFFPTFYI